MALKIANLYPTYFLLCNNLLHVFRSNHQCSWKFHKFHRILFFLHWSLFFKKLQACRLRVFQIAVMGSGGNFFTGWREPEEDWFWQFKPFSKLKTAFCKYWTLIKIKINMTCVSKEYQIKKKMEQELCVQLKILFLLGYNLKIVF